MFSSYGKQVLILNILNEWCELTTGVKGYNQILIIVFSFLRFLVDDLVASYARLKDSASVDAEEIEEEEITDAEGELNEKRSQSENICRNEEMADKEHNISLYEAHANVIFDLSAVAEIVTYKSSVVGVSSLRLVHSCLYMLNINYAVVTLNNRIPLICISGKLSFCSRRGKSILQPLRCLRRLYLRWTRKLPSDFQLCSFVLLQLCILIPKGMFHTCPFYAAVSIQLLNRYVIMS